MIYYSILALSVISVSWGAEDLTFPPAFQFGVATAAYQTEGAWNVSDKSESIWDKYLHEKHSSTPVQDTGDVACESYRLWKRDVEMVEQLEVDFYRFSISWTRILPNGFSNHISKEGTKYYSNLIDALLEKGIEPVVTLYHFDLPQRLQDLGGWTNPLISEWFADYARIVFSLYADRVKTWFTINEPVVVCEITYQYGFLAPGIVSPEGSLLCSRHILLAHAKAWRVYDEEFKAKYHGRVSITNLQFFVEPLTDEDEDLAELVQQHVSGLYTNPIFSKEGGWPPVVEKLIADYSKELGYPRSNLPPFSSEEIALLKGTYDFYALNYYTSRTVRRANDSEIVDPWPTGVVPHLNGKLDVDPSWEPTAIAFYFKYPEGLRKLLNWVKKEYGDVPVFIAENGLSNDGGLQDNDRIKYIRDHLKQVLLAIKEDGINVTAFTVWSLMDNFEWDEKYRPKFGLYEVDFSSPDRERTPRASAFYYTSIIRNRTLDVPEDITVAVLIKTPAVEKTSYYVYIVGGVLLVVGTIITLVVYRLRKRRMQITWKDSFNGVQIKEDF